MSFKEYLPQALFIGYMQLTAESILSNLAKDSFNKSLIFFSSFKSTFFM